MANLSHDPLLRSPYPANSQSLQSPASFPTAGTAGPAIRTPEIEFLYFVAYGWIQPFILVLGIIGNTLNLCVLLNPKRKHVTHILMRGMALSDSIVVYTLIPIIYYRHVTYLNRFNQSIDNSSALVTETQQALKVFDSLFEDVDILYKRPDRPWHYNNAIKPYFATNLYPAKNSSLQQIPPNRPVVIPLPQRIPDSDDAMVNEEAHVDTDLIGGRKKRYSPFEYYIDSKSMNGTVLKLETDPRKVVDGWWNWWMSNQLQNFVAHQKKSPYPESRMLGRKVSLSDLIRSNNTFYERTFKVEYPMSENASSSHLLLPYYETPKSSQKLLSITGINKGKLGGQGLRSRPKVFMQRTQHQLNTKWWSYYRLFGLYLTVNTFFAASTFVTVSMAMERFVTVYYPFRCSRICSRNRTRLMVAISFAIAIIISLPLAWDYAVVCRPEVIVTKTYGVFSNVQHPAPLPHPNLTDRYELVGSGIEEGMVITRYFANGSTKVKHSPPVSSLHDLTLISNFTFNLVPQNLTNGWLPSDRKLWDEGKDNGTWPNNVTISIHHRIISKLVATRINKYYRDHNLVLHGRYSYRVVYKWIWAFCLRMAPIVLLVIFNMLIIAKLRSAARRRASLMNHTQCSSGSYGLGLGSVAKFYSAQPTVQQARVLNNYVRQKIVLQSPQDDICYEIEPASGPDECPTEPINSVPYKEHGQQNGNPKIDTNASPKSTHGKHSTSGSLKLSNEHLHRDRKHSLSRLSMLKSSLGKVCHHPMTRSVKGRVWFSVPETDVTQVEMYDRVKRDENHGTEAPDKPNNPEERHVGDEKRLYRKIFKNSITKRLFNERSISSIPKSRQHRSSSTSTASTVTSLNKHSVRHQIYSPSLKLVRREQNLTKLLIAVSCLFTVCVTPQVFVMTQGYEGSRLTSYSYHLFTVIANLLEITNYCLDFYLYCLCSADFRRHLKEFFRNMFGRRSGKTNFKRPTNPKSF